MKKIIIANIISLTVVILFLFPILNKRGMSDQAIGVIIGRIFLYIILGEIIVFYGSKMRKKIKNNTDEKISQAFKK